MSKQLKHYLKQDLKSRLGEERQLVLLRIDRLDVANANALRSQLRGEGARMTVLRNRVARHAFRELEMEDAGTLLAGQSAVAYGGEQGVLAVSRIVSDFTKKNRNAGVEILGGFVDGRVITPADVETLATLPSREQLLAMVASVVVAPMQQIASQLNEMVAGVARAVDAVREQKEQAA